MRKQIRIMKDEMTEEEYKAYRLRKNREAIEENYREILERDKKRNWSKSENYDHINPMAFKNAADYYDAIRSQTDPVFTKQLRAEAKRIVASMKISKPEDKLEKDADRTAKEIMNKEPDQEQNYDKSSTGMSFFEERFNADFSGVKIKNDDNAHKMAEALNARAFTIKDEIYFNKGEYQPDTEKGKELIAHELTHTIQQVDTIHKLEKKANNSKQLTKDEKQRRDILNALLLLSPLLGQLALTLRPLGLQIAGGAIFIKAAATGRGVVGLSFGESIAFIFDIDSLSGQFETFSEFNVGVGLEAGADVGAGVGVLIAPINKRVNPINAFGGPSFGAAGSLIAGLEIDINFSIFMREEGSITVTGTIGSEAGANIHIGAKLDNTTIRKFINQIIQEATMEISQLVQSAQQALMDMLATAEEKVFQLWLEIAGPEKAGEMELGFKKYVIKPRDKLNTIVIELMSNDRSFGNPNSSEHIARFTDFIVKTNKIIYHKDFIPEGGIIVLPSISPWD